MYFNLRTILLLLLAFGFNARVNAFSKREQAADSISAGINKTKNTPRMYFSWGYNKEWYSNSDIHIEQPSLGNDYVFENTQAHDRIGWDKLFQNALTIPQYNYRIGYFLKDPAWAVELNFDHTKYLVSQGQTVNVKGKINSQAIDKQVYINPHVLFYMLNNGANFFLFNIVRSLELLKTTDGTPMLLGLAKIGVGPVVPHVENTIFDHPNTPHFQLGGWNTGVELALKSGTVCNFYLEFCSKLDYASYSGLRIYEGTARHSFFTYELILNLGYTLGY